MIKCLLLLVLCTGLLAYTPTISDNKVKPNSVPKKNDKCVSISKEKLIESIIWVKPDCSDQYVVFMMFKPIYITSDETKRDLFIATLKARIYLMTTDK